MLTFDKLYSFECIKTKCDMNKIRPVILAVAVVAAALLAYGMFTLPKAQPADAEGFSAARVVEDIEVISKEHHSVAAVMAIISA